MPETTGTRTTDGTLSHATCLICREVIWVLNSDRKPIPFDADAADLPGHGTVLNVHDCMFDYLDNPEDEWDLP